jgi:hypothetical protein
VGLRVERDDGLHVRLGIDDWQRLYLAPGQRIPGRLSGRSDAWLFVTDATELPPVVWVVLAGRVRVAG